MGYGSKHTPSIQKNKFRIKTLYLTEEGYVWKDMLEKLEEDSVCAIFAHTASDEKTYKVGLTTWKSAPEGKIQKFDVSIAKSCSPVAASRTSIIENK